MADRKRLAARLLLVPLSALAALAVGELGLRVYFHAVGNDAGDMAAVLRRARHVKPGEGGRLSLIGLVQASRFPEVVYELKPSLSGTFRGRPIAIDAQGLRGAANHAPAKPPGTFRIAGLGDSVMFGWGVGEGEPYLQILERDLNRRAAGRRHYETLNFGVPGYNTWMEVATFEHRALAFSPDLVVVHFIGNDFELPHFMRRPESRRSPARWYLVELVRALFRSPQDEVDPDLLGHGSGPAAREDRARARGQYAHMVGVDAFKTAMARLGALCRERRIPVIVMALGSGAGAAGIAEEAARANDMTYLDASPHFYAYLVAHGLAGERANWVKVFRIPHDGHPNALGHRLYAEVLAQELARRGIP
jgi:lysophospholipase L1-like esterase